MSWPLSASRLLLPPLMFAAPTATPRGSKDNAGPATGALPSGGDGGLTSSTTALYHVSRPRSSSTFNTSPGASDGAASAAISAHSGAGNGSKWQSICVNTGRKCGQRAASEKLSRDSSWKRAAAAAAGGNGGGRGAADSRDSGGDRPRSCDDGAASVSGSAWDYSADADNNGGE